MALIWAILSNIWAVVVITLDVRTVNILVVMVWAPNVIICMLVMGTSMVTNRYYTTYSVRATGVMCILVV